MAGTGALAGYAAARRANRWKPAQALGQGCQGRWAMTPARVKHAEGGRSVWSGRIGQRGTRETPLPVRRIT